MQQKVLFRLLGAVLFLVAALNLSAQGTAIFYQGRLDDSGAPANTNYDLRFAVFSGPTSGLQVSGSITNFSVPVSNGLFSVTLNFGPGIFNGTINGSNDWLDIGVRLSGTTNFTSLAPRQPILPVPYALFATSASNLLGSLQSTQLVGTVPSSAISGIYSNFVDFANGTNLFAGNGAGLTNLNASQIASGTLANARLSTDVPLLDGAEGGGGGVNTFTANNNFYGNGVYTGSNTFTGNGTYTGANTFSNSNNSFTGSFFGNGLVGWVAVPGFTQQAVRDHGYMLTSPSFTTVTLPSSSSLTAGDIVRVSGAGSGGWAVAVNAGQSIIGSFASFHANSLFLPGAAGNDWRSLACSSDGTRMYAGGNLSSGVYYSTDFGHSWNPTTISGNGFAVACSASGNIVFAAATGATSPIQGSGNGGLNFVSLGAPTLTWNSIACSADGSKFIAAPASGYLYTWNNGTFSQIAGPLNWSVVACSADGNRMAAAVSSGNIAVTVNAGSSWGYVTAPASGNCTALAAAAYSQKLVATYTGGAGGGIATSTNFGTSWTITSAPAGSWSCLAASADCNQLVAGMNNGLVYASANFGATWTTITTTNQYWSGLCMSADGTKYAGTVSSVGSYSGGIFYSSSSPQPITTATNGISGCQGSAVEIQYIGNNQFMPVSSSGILWAN